MCVCVCVFVCVCVCVLERDTYPLISASSIQDMFKHD